MMRIGSRRKSLDLLRNIMERILAKIKNYLPEGVFRVLQPAYHFALAFLAAARYGFPSRRLIVIGITGTKGKTTTVHLVHEILQASGAMTASLSSVRFKIGEREETNDLKMSMPGRFFVQHFLRRAVAAGCRYMVIEVTSQGIAQSRHRFINFSSAILTNIAPEHIESHGNFEKYIRAKLDLFWRLSPDAMAIVNCDDAAAGRLNASTRAHQARYGRDGIMIGGKKWLVKDLEISDKGITFDIGGHPFNSPLRGEFNYYNILAATAVGLNRRIALDTIAEAVRSFSGVPGRMEFVQREPFAVVVDYAHTPDSLRAVYETWRRENQESSKETPRDPMGQGQAGIKNQKKRLICVLGATGGGRDKWKRPEFGRIAAEYCAEVFLTDEDPYDENPVSILDEIVAGIPIAEMPRVHKIMDRRQAIGAALRAARPGDTVVITGKGAEPWMMVRGSAKIPWDDRAIAREELEKLN